MPVLLIEGDAITALGLIRSKASFPSGLMDYMVETMGARWVALEAVAMLCAAWSIGARNGTTLSAGRTPHISG